MVLGKAEHGRWGQTPPLIFQLKLEGQQDPQSQVDMEQSGTWMSSRGQGSGWGLPGFLDIPSRSLGGEPAQEQLGSTSWVLASPRLPPSTVWPSCTGVLCLCHLPALVLRTEGLLTAPISQQVWQEQHSKQDLGNCQCILDSSPLALTRPPQCPGL